MGSLLALTQHGSGLSRPLLITTKKQAARSWRRARPGRFPGWLKRGQSLFSISA
jgi:hypothetical protein